MSATPTTKTAKAKPRKASKLFVLDTNVLMHDPSCLYRFDEHDLHLPMVTLEELDAHKKGVTEVARNARQASRFMDEILSAHPGAIDVGCDLTGPSGGAATGRLFLQCEAVEANLLPASMPQAKADNQIIGVLLHLRKQVPDREVILVSKDINMRIKARAVGLEAQDYFNDKVLEDTDLLWSGHRAMPTDFWMTHGDQLESWKDGAQSIYRVQGPLVRELLSNEFLYDEANDTMFRVGAVGGVTATLKAVIDYSHDKHAVWGINARNREQNYALNLLMDPEVDCVTLLGQAGTGKTLITLAAALTQVLETKRYSEIIMTRITVPVGEDIGFLPGTEEEKMAPWMGALEDNLDVLNGNVGEGAENGAWGRAATMDLLRSRIKVKSLNFMRGRTFINKFLIIDEAQNLTSKQMKTLITRAGPGTKVVCLGNIAQIDTPYLSEGSSGLTFVVDRFKGWPHAGHVTLARGERSRLADHASEVL
ncbi:MAG: PhoH-like ATPase [Azoarcus sp.]|nr:PhoH-like ATPase [Azoarcus sp.]